MERDFLGIHGKDSGAQVKEEPRGSRQDSGILGGSAVQWPFSNKVSSVQQFLSFKAAQEGRPKKVAFDQLCPSGFQAMSTGDAFDANHKSSPVVASQKCFSLDRQGVHQFMMQPYQSQNSDSFGTTKQTTSETGAFPLTAHHSIPVATSSPFFKIHGSPHSPSITISSLKQQAFGGGTAANSPSLASIIGAFTPRNVSKTSPTTAQLTIFYAGSVNAYDDVPLDKALAIMSLASSGSNLTPAMNPMPEIPVSLPSKVAGVDDMDTCQTHMQTPNQVTPSCSGLSSPISITSHAGAHSVSGSTKADDVAGAKTIGLSAPTSQHESSKTITTGLGSASTVTLMPRAVPQARKASLARFLEKRKERVTNAMPYSYTKKAAGDTNGVDDANLCSKASSPEIALSSNMERPWGLNQPKNGLGSGVSPSTKLEM